VFEFSVDTISCRIILDSYSSGWQFLFFK